jgi:mRNA-degrading endonuclease RelE of RelBE toxin-antitoxin system
LKQGTWGKCDLVAFRIMISPRAQKYLKSLDKREAGMIRESIDELRDDPFTPRPECDIIKEKGKRPPLYRLRVGRHRAEYFIEDDTIFVSRMFLRSGDSDYR